MYHYHIAKGSMKDAHNLDDRRDRASICMREAPPVQVASNATSVLSGIEKLRAALRARDAQQSNTIVVQ